MQIPWQQLQQQLAGALYFDGSAMHGAQRRAYATDASVYEEMPVAVAIPNGEKDLVTLVAFARQYGQTLIPRAAGTSLAGQVVGNGIVVDIGPHFNQVIALNEAERWVSVQPGVIRDDLNHYLKPHGLMFGPETSTASRAMLGGMLGNNSCGLHSIVWGSVRDHLLEAKLLLSDGSSVLVNAVSSARDYVSGNALYDAIKKQLWQVLDDPAMQQMIRQNTAKPTVRRRNTGYALDALLDCEPFSVGGPPFNLCRLLAGSEGTLAVVTEMTLQLLPLPPKQSALVCVHCASLQEALLANALAIALMPMAAELVDKCIMDFTIDHPLYSANRFFIEGDPAAMLMVEFMHDDLLTVQQMAQQLISVLQNAGNGYAYPILYNEQAAAAWDIRKAGLGLLRNTAGQLQPVNLIEDCAVAPEDLPAYIADLELLLKKYQVTASFYAHAGAGELHVEPMLDLTSSEGLFKFRNILQETVTLVKKYNGSLSGEHGDGRLRGEFIEQMVGSGLMELFRLVKQIFDPHNVFNANKLVDAPPMDKHLRKGLKRPGEVVTQFNFDKEGGLLKLAERCSGSGDCRRSAVSTGLMCPSYMATRNELDTTRARANVLRQFLSNPEDAAPLEHEEIYQVMDLCLSCKGCKVECPSGVDITKMKAAFLQQYYQSHPVPFRTKLIAHYAKQMKWASRVPFVYNALMGTSFIRRSINRLIGFHPERTIPLLPGKSLRRWYGQRKSIGRQPNGKLYFFCDEFTNYVDAGIGIKAIQLLERLGYEVLIPHHLESGRTYLSKGLVQQAAAIAAKNTALLSPLLSADVPLVGIEPSAILTLRDEYKDLATKENRAAALALAAHSFTIEEFLYREMQAGRIQQEQFTNEPLEIALHTHCYQKVLSAAHYSRFILSFPRQYSVVEIPAGCCGMAGSFGYEREHFAVSQQVGALQLFPYLRAIEPGVVVAAAGTSCRHQVADGVGKRALHPVEILWAAMV